MSDEDPSKRQSYATFLEGTAERLHSLLKRKAVEPEALSGNVERHLIGALEIVTGAPVEFVDNDHAIGYQFIRTEKLGGINPTPSHGTPADLVESPIWEAVQKNLTDPTPVVESTKNFSIEERYRIVMEYLSAECRSEELCDREGITVYTLLRWTLDFLDAGRNTLEKAEMSDTIEVSDLNATLSQKVEFEVDQLKAVLARLIRQNTNVEDKHTEPASVSSKQQSFSQS